MKYKILENPNYEETYELIEEGDQGLISKTKYSFWKAIGAVLLKGWKLK